MKKVSLVVVIFLELLDEFFWIGRLQNLQRTFGCSSRLSAKSRKVKSRVRRSLIPVNMIFIRQSLQTVHQMLEMAYERKFASKFDEYFQKA